MIWGNALGFALALSLALGCGPAAAQRKPPPEKKEVPARVEPRPEPAFVADGKATVFHGLDKVTARIVQFEASIGETARFGSLEIVVRRCQRSRPDQKPERGSFVEIDEIDSLSRSRKRLFAGWMFGSNPALSALDHPVYDVWVKDCK